MPYTPKTWENKPSTASPINATNLNHMEGGIKTNDDNIISAQNAILTLQGEMLQAQGDISALETLVDSIFPVDTETGNPTVITDAFGGACKSLKLTLEPIQSGSGTPSPQNIRPISGRTQTEITRCGKNIIASVVAGVWLGTTGELVSNNNYSASNKIKVTPGATYTVSATVSGLVGTDDAILFYDANGVYLGQNTGGLHSFSVFPHTFTVPANAYYCAIDINMAFSNFISAQLEYGSTATTYEAYNGESVTVQLGQTVYGGVLDVTSGVLNVLYALIDLGTLTWTYHSDVAAGVFASADITNRKISADLSPLCDIYEYGGVVSAASVMASKPNNTFCFYYLASATNTTIYVVNTSYSDAAAFKTAMSGVYLAYELATPTIVQLTPEEVSLLKINNVLTTDTDNIEASYSADIALYIDKKIAEGSNNNRSVDNSSLSKGGSGDEEPKEETKEEVKEEEIEIKEVEPLTKEVR